MSAEDLPSLVGRILAQAEATPNAVAVEHGAFSITYRDLAARSGHWAAALGAFGVRPGDRVGLSLPRGIDLAVALLAILRAGAAYVPIDATYPSRRREQMRRLAGVAVLVAEAGQGGLDAGADAEDAAVRAVTPAMLDERADAMAAAGADAPWPAGTTDPERLTYVIFTSGSTGVPKGVMLPQRTLAALLDWQRTDGGLGAPARTLQFTPVSFDVHAQEFLGTWCTGGTLVMVEDAVRRDPQQLLRFLAAQRIERLFLPFVALHQLAEAARAEPAVELALRDVVTAGEALVRTDALVALFRRLPAARLHNHYGPSETHVATAYTLPPDPTVWPALPPIGRPVSGSQAIVLDEQGHEAAPEVEGELVLGGACVGAGYIGLPEATAERFVSLPGFDGRWYRTGDLARRDTEGQLHFVGRRDGQVKVRGHRVEVGEVESVLGSLSEVAACAVVPTAVDGGGHRLVAYVVPAVAEPPVTREPSASLDAWREVWDSTYSADATEAVDPRANFRGWNSSYDGEPLDPGAMQRWVDGTRDRILRENPARVLEVGAGTGLILFAVAPHVERYDAVDFSQRAVALLARSVTHDLTLRERCSVRQGAAHEIADLSVSGTVYDAVVLNSVTQHFESVGYLQQVLQQASRLLKQGGRIFVGDVTALPTRELFHATVESAQPGAPTESALLRRRVARRCADDRELTLDARWFYRAVEADPRLSVMVQLKPGGYDNELSRYRFDVTVRVADPARVSAPEMRTVAWDPSWTATRLLDALSSGTATDAAVVRLTQVPNARLHDVQALAERLELAAPSDMGIDPDAFHALAGDDITVHTFPTSSTTYDVVLTRGTVRAADWLTDAEVQGDPRRFASRPYLTANFAATSARLRAGLTERLPEYMVPSRFVAVPSLPLTPSGKVDRQRVPDAGTARPPLPTPYVAPATTLERDIAMAWARVLGLDDVGVLDNFFDLGGTSLLSLQLTQELARVTAAERTVVELFQHPTVRAYAANIAETPHAPERTTSEAPGTSASAETLRDVAVIGMSLRFPGAASPEAFWHNLTHGVESLRHFTDDELRAAGVPESRIANPAFVKVRGLFDEPEAFDAAFFGYSARDAALMDPQHRVFLEACWSALEHSGHAPGRMPGDVGVWGGLSTGMEHNVYLLSNLHGNPAAGAPEDVLPAMLGSANDYLTTRVSHRLDLRGPSVSVQTACSTSLTAIALAYQSLVTGGCDTALAGGVAVSYPQVDGYEHQEGGIGSPDGHCRPFDADAAGTVFSNGVGVVVLKRLADALADGDQVYAVIRGVALNNDGASKMSFAAPSVDGQARVITRAQAAAGVSPETVEYVECHGTATPIGDPIEVTALTRVFGSTHRRHFCALGSVKSNFGHLDSAAGVAGFIKAVLALHHEQIPPTLHFRRPNPAIDLTDSPFYVADRLIPWPRRETPRRAGVSAFGIGGTNVHVVLEEAPVTAAVATDTGAPRAEWLPISAKTASALDDATMRLAEHLETTTTGPLHDTAFTLQEGRAAFAHRRVVVAASATEAARALRANDRRAVVHGKAPASGGALAFLYSGGGTQYVSMGRELVQAYPVVREWVERGLTEYQARTGVDLAAIWFAEEPDHPDVRVAFERPSLQLPAIFILQVALTRQWMAWGIQPAALLGHSLGENTAAHIAGVLSYEDALGLVLLRGELFECVAPGGMLSVACSSDVAARYLSAAIDLATVNGPAQCTLSGDRDALAALTHRLDADGVEYQPIPIAIAAHSHLLDPILGDFQQYLERITLHAPRIPIVSNRTGTWLSAADAQRPTYWVEHLRNTVQFAAGVSLLATDPDRVFLEMGPGKVLSSLARLEGRTPSERIIASMRHAAEPITDDEALQMAVARLWTVGAPLDWASLRRSRGGTTPRRVPLPTYPFARTRHFIAPGAMTPLAAPAATPPGAPMSMSEISAGPAPAPSPERSVSEPQRPMGRSAIIQQRLQVILHEMSGMPLADVDVQTTFLDMGFDSLFLTQANLRFKKEFKVKVTFRQLFDDAPTIAALAAYIDAQLPTDALPELVAAPPVAPASDVAPAPVAPIAVSGAVSGAVSAMPALHQAIALQIQANTALLAAIQGGSVAAAAPAVSAPEAPAAAAVPAPTRPPFTPTVTRPAATGRFGPFKPVQKNLTESLSAAQEAYLAEFIARVIAKTPQSKQYTAAHRAHFADPRAVSGFKQAWKEITYPIVGDRSKGALVWDIDGNEYVDCAGGFGATFFGHAPDFVLDAVRAQMERSVDYAPQSPLAGPTAQLICSLTGHERAAFCNTGSEAVLAAMRMARTVTGNDTIVSFYGSYHGMFDEVLVRPQEVNGVRVNKPVAPGIPGTAGSNLVVLEYGDPASLAYIESIADELAGVIVEPIQSRNPELQPVAFVRELRALTARLGIPLIFDEIITGFRLHPRGAQGWYDVDADLCAYGKVVGGGMPVGVVAGKATYMDALDGGGWQYGDDSFPEAGVTYFAGTFVRHPTALAAVNAAMTRLVAEGPELQAQLNRRTALFCERVNRAYHEMGVPIELTYFASVILPRWYGHPDYESLYFHHLRFHGAHIWEGRPGFFSTAHTDEHFARLLDSFVAAAHDLQKAGFLPVAATGERRPFTDAQQELWLALAMGPDARAAYNEQVLFEFATALDTEVLELTFDKVVNRHASLRSVVAADGSGIEVRRYMRPEFSVVDLRDGDRAGREAHAHRLVAAHIDREFDLTSGPLVRLLVIRLDEERTWLALAASHLVCDGWSLEVVMQDIAHFHEAMRTGRQIDRGTPPALAEYDRAWSERVAEGDVGDAEQYWTKRFSPPPEPVELPFDHPRPPVKTYRGVRQHFVVDAPAADALRAFARNQGCTLFVAALTAYDVLLHRLSGHDDLVIGIPAAGQPTLGLTGLVAHDVRFLPVREHIDAAAPLARLVEQVRRTFNDAQGARDFTYGQLLQRIRPRRDPSRLPLITAAFNLDLEMSPVTLHGARGRFLTTPRGFVKYDLFFNLIDLGAGRGLELEVDHNSDLLHTETARQWAQHFMALLEAMPRHAETPVADVPLRAAAHDTAWALAGADTHADSAPDTLVSMFEAAVDRYGESVAFSTEEASYRYVDLEAEANQIAQWLRDEGLGPDDVVAVLFERSAMMLSTIYGVLKAGAAYLPLDPGNPAARLVEILTAARPRRLLCLRQDLARLAAFLPTGIEVRAVDDPQAGWRSRSRERLPHRAAPDHLAYVIYTSGSTGTPKGVMNTHRGIASRLRWAQRHFGMTTRDVVIQKTPYTFDVSVWELFWPLQVGARLVVARPGGHKDPRYLRDTIAAQGITVAHFVPSMLNAFMAEPGVEALDSLRVVICSGEALTAAQRDRWRELRPATALHNLYGPTEAAVDVTWWTCDAQDQSDPVPIGWPVDDTRLYILDAAGRPVPHGAHGELCIGGVQVARGYLHDDARTAERFVTLTLGGERVRVYRTGDRVRQRFDGAIEFLGRLDDQVKLRGLRIELGEVEAKLLDIEGVHAAVAFVARHGEQDDRLVAVVQPTPGVVLSQLKLRRELANTLPEYMVPQLFSVVEQLPLNASGKIDRAAVRAAVGAIAPSPGFRAPQSGAEQRIAEIWCRVLRVDRVSADAFFFDVGGHSLLALTAAREMEAAFGCRVDLRELLMSNLSQLAVQLDSLGSRVAG